jgi:membrane-bound lytic murein transglycosylase A
MLKQAPDKPIQIGAEIFEMQRWFPICHQALQQKPLDAKQFFEQYFEVKTWKHPGQGLITGYYSPTYPGRLKADAEFRFPVYAKPKDLVTLNLQDFVPSLAKKILYGKIKNQQLLPYDTREQIAQGSLKGRAEVLAWLKSPMDALDLEIQGAGVVATPERTLVLNYAAQNGLPYQALGRILIQQGFMEKRLVTMQKIREFFEQNPEKVSKLFALNPSYVFFKVIPEFKFYGAQNINLSPGYSIAVDPRFVALGTPVLISTTLPHHQRPWHRLMIAQDIGGAIKGKIRADIYWGRGNKAQQLASDMKQSGKMWFLIPRKSETRGNEKTSI